MSELDGLWKHPNNPACTRSVRVIIMFKMNTIRKKKKKKPLRTVLHICRRNRMSPDSTPETLSRSLLLSTIHAGMGMRSSFKTTAQEIIVSVLTQITCSSGGSRLFHGQRNQRTCLQPHVCWTASGTCQETASHATRHERALWCTPVGIATRSTNLAANGSCLAVETSVNLIYLSIYPYWFLPSSKPSSSHTTN